MRNFTISALTVCAFFSSLGALACQDIEFPELKRNIEFKRTSQGGYSGDFKIKIKDRGFLGKSVDLLEHDEIVLNCHQQDRLWWRDGYDVVYRTYSTDNSGMMRLYRYNAKTNQKTLISSKFPTDTKYERVSDNYVLKNKDILFVVSKRNNIGDQYRTSLYLNRYGQSGNSRIQVEIFPNIFERAKMPPKQDMILFLEPKTWALHDFKSNKTVRFGKDIYYSMGAGVFHPGGAIYARDENELVNLYLVEFLESGSRETLLAKDVRQSPACEYLGGIDQFACIRNSFYFPAAVSCPSGDKVVFRRGRNGSPESVWITNVKTGAEVQVRAEKKVYTGEAALLAFCDR